MSDQHRGRQRDFSPLPYSDNTQRVSKASQTKDLGISLLYEGKHSCHSGKKGPAFGPFGLSRTPKGELLSRFVAGAHWLGPSAVSGGLAATRTFRLRLHA